MKTKINKGDCMSYFESFYFWEENFNEKMVPDPDCLGEDEPQEEDE